MREDGVCQSGAPSCLGSLLIIIDVARTLYKLETRLPRTVGSPPSPPPSLPPLLLPLLPTHRVRRTAPASATWNHLHAAGRTNPRSPGHPLPPRSPTLFALQPGGRRKLLEFSKSDVQDIMNEGMASSRRWRRWWSSNRGCLQRAGGGRGRQGSGRREIGRDGRRGAAVVRRYPGKTTRLGSLFCLQNHPPAHSSSLNYIPT